MMQNSFRRNAGFGMLEVLISLVIILTGLLGLAGLLTLSRQAEMESYQRAQALVLLEDMANRLNANRKVAACYDISTDPTTQFMGNGTSVTPTCTTGTNANQQAQAVADLNAWNSALLGASELTGGTNCTSANTSNCAGAMIGARGCITSTATDTYLISVAWQGLNTTFAPPAGLDCGKNLYGDERQRRVVSTVVHIANLTAP